MELIQFNKNGGTVTIDITINGANIWSYEYVGDSTFKNNSAYEQRAPRIYSAYLPTSTMISTPGTYALETFQSDSVVAAATILWKQDGQVLKTWTEQVLVPAESVANVSANALLIGNALTVVV